MEYFKLFVVLNFVTLISIISTTCQNDSWQQELLSNEKEMLLNGVSDTLKQNQFRELLLKEKHNRKKIINFEYLEDLNRNRIFELERLTGFYHYECAINVIKTDLRMNALNGFTIDPEQAFYNAGCKLKETAIYKNSIRKFKEIERLIWPPIDKQYLASKNIVTYFSRIITILSLNHTNGWYTNSERKRQKFIQGKLKEYLVKEELTYDDMFYFAFDIARIRHACNMYNLAIRDVILSEFDRKIRVSGKRPLFEDLLEELKIADAWNVTERSVDYVNILRQYKFNVLRCFDRYQTIKVYHSKSSNGTIIPLLNYPTNMCLAVNKPTLTSPTL